MLAKLPKIAARQSIVADIPATSAEMVEATFDGA